MWKHRIKLYENQHCIYHVYKKLKEIASWIYASIDYLYSNRCCCFFKFIVHAAYLFWQLSSEDCKLKHKSYLFGDVNLTDPVQACTLIQGNLFGPSWIGIGKELYIGVNGGRF